MKWKKNSMNGSTWNVDNVYGNNDNASLVIVMEWNGADFITFTL